jgi:hypothetical protein
MALVTLKNKTVIKGSSILGTRLWTPDLEAGTTTWLDANDPNTITQSGGSVSNWYDKINNWDFQNLNAASQPEYGNSLHFINGRKTIYFDRDTQDILNFAAPGNGNPNPLGTIGQATGEITIFMVKRYISPAPAAASIRVFNMEGSLFGAHAPWVGGGVIWDIGNTIGGDGRLNAGGYVSDMNSDEEFFSTFYVRPSDSTREVYKNGSLFTSQNPTTNSVILSNNNFNIGRYQKVGIGEMIFHNGAMSSTLREKYEGYLAHRWNLNNKLPGGHTYKGAPPTI